MTNRNLYIYSMYSISMPCVRKAITIREDQSKFIEEHNLKLSKITQKAIDQIIAKEVNA
jgi:hypothetical protein